MSGHSNSPKMQTAPNLVDMPRKSQLTWEELLKRPPELLASPYELAQLAVSLALMRGVKEPDVDGAAQLLWESALAIDGVLRPHRFEGEVIKSAGIKRSELLRWPSLNEFPMSFDAAVSLIVGRRDAARKRRVLDLAFAKLPAVRKFSGSINDEGEFIHLATLMAPYVPRIRKARASSEDIQPQQVARRNDSGEFTRARRGPHGKFAKQKKSV